MPPRGQGAARVDRVGQVIETVGDGDDPGSNRNVLVGQAVRIAAAVDPFMVRQNGGQYGLRQASGTLGDFVAHPAMALIDRLLVLVAGRIAQDRRTDRQLADVVEQGRDAQGAERFAG